MSAFLLWLSDVPLWLLGIALLLCMSAVAGGAYKIRTRHNGNGTKVSEGQEGYIVSAILGLLALLMGFTFSLAIDRFETRRELVLEDSNAIGTAYLRAQLLGEPHRARLSKLLIALTDEKLALATATRDRIPALVAKENTTLTDIWAATAAGFDSIKGLDFSSTFVDSMNSMIDLDASRRAARLVRVPAEVFAVLLIYMVVTAGALGYVLSGSRGRLAAAFLLTLFTMSLLLIVDIDRPISGGIRESQWPMEQLRASMRSQSTATYDRWRAPPDKR